jgi:hypothetical protein
LVFSDGIHRQYSEPKAEEIEKNEPCAALALFAALSL